MTKKPDTDVIDDAELELPSRRKLFKQSAAALGAAAAAPIALRAGSAHAAEIGPETANQRQKNAYDVREAVAKTRRQQTYPEHPDNGDEARYPERFASYHKGLPHTNDGLVDLPSYALMIAALESGNDADFDLVPTGARQTNPQSAYTYELVGADSHMLTMPPAPEFASAEAAGEMVESYWQALTRDVAFADYETDPDIARACNDLSALSDFKGPTEAGGITPSTIFRGIFPGDESGIYISQFLLLDVPFGPRTIEQKYNTRLPGYDHNTTYLDWLAIQRGHGASGDFITPPIVSDPDNFDPQTRYLRNNRDLAEYVHQCFPVGDPLFAGLICLGFGANALDRNNPYFNRPNQAGFVTFGISQVLSLIGVAADAALKACWYQKWLVHRRLRPEAFGGRVHDTLTGTRAYPIHSDLLASDAMAAVDERFGGFLLPMAYKEGSPTHPAYPSGHATIIGACATILKAFFHEDYIIERPVMPSADGLSLVPLPTDYGAPTLGDELNKFASNVAIGRNAGAVHYRSDAIESLRLGEQVAIEILTDYRGTYNEQFDGFSLTKFDGTPILV